MAFVLAAVEFRQADPTAGKTALVDILVAPRAACLDFCNRVKCHLDLIEVLILDEADRMLDMGLYSPVRQIIRPARARATRQTCCFPPPSVNDVMNLSQQWDARSPTIVEIEPGTRLRQKTSIQQVYAVPPAATIQAALHLLPSSI